MRVRAVVLRAPGTNCERETAHALRLAGAEVEVELVSRLVAGRAGFDGAHLLVLPGGFSYGDDLGAGTILAQALRKALAPAIEKLLGRGGLVLGICNGFQALVKAGLLPGFAGDPRPLTLTWNRSGRFESRWVKLVASREVRTPFLEPGEALDVPVAHGEGRVAVRDARVLERLREAGQVALRYADAAGRPADAYPENPNGSLDAIAGICDPTGQVLGLMPHPERNVERWHHPLRTREAGAPPESAAAVLAREPDGLRFFRRTVERLERRLFGDGAVTRDGLLAASTSKVAGSGDR